MARKKMGRNKESCKAYKASGRREINKIAKLKRELKKQPTNFQVIRALKARDEKAGKEAERRAKQL